jgi:membrane-bound lytic murein transglycosylase MltF
MERYNALSVAPSPDGDYVKHDELIGLINELRRQNQFLTHLLETIRDNGTLKYGKNTQSWEDVSYFLNLKSDPEFYRDPMVKSGFAKGHIAVNYVRDILNLFESYKALVQP